ncbi:MAG: hypothetical protein A3C56_02535 [Ignavibacteria bacterium RIFCSPHIGHO2_02_FULL_56_12]|nr:MAG: hypothetical protein A3C56_02535 [Ignavibacteria bacterium RIFCSPHIGHO2_02_FULL_56_12]
MILILIAIVLFVFGTLAEAEVSLWIIFPVVIVISATWVLLTNYLGWRLIGWVLVAEGKTLS